MKTYLILISLLIAGLLNAQSDCSTVVTQEDMDYFDGEQADRNAFSYDLADTGIIQIPIVNHIVRRTDGTGGLTTQELTIIMQDLNAFYAQTNIEFIECESVKYINNSNWYNFSPSDDFEVYSTNNVQGSLNIYYFNTVGGYCGYTNVPNANPRDRIMMKNSCALNGTTLIHEVGHYFSLFHTHGTSNCGTTDELVNGSNCENAGDRICDTPADPNLYYNCQTRVVDEDCVYTGNFQDANGQQYNPQTNNIMSYSRQACRSIFTQGQFDNIVYSALNQRNYLSCGNNNQPDLTISTHPISPDVVDCGSTVMMTAVVTNNGNTESDESKMGYYFSDDAIWDNNDIFLAEDQVESLGIGTASGQFANIMIPEVTPGTYYILFVADYLNTVSESDEDNNIAIHPIAVNCSGPDLVITSASVSPNIVTCGSAITANTTVKNNGNTSSTGTHLLYYLSTDTNFDEGDDTYLNFSLVGGLAVNSPSNQSINLSLPENLSTGNYYILFVADGLDNVAESNENNNIAYQEITVTCGNPDLTITSQPLSPSMVNCGDDNVLALAVVTNNGDVAANESTMHYYFSNDTILDGNDTYLAEDPVESLGIGTASGEYAYITIPTDLNSGTYYILFVADYSNEVAESNENNNITYQPISVNCDSDSDPDLIISSSSVSPNTVTCGGTTSVTAVVKNDGDISTGATSFLRYYLSDDTTWSGDDNYLGYDAVYNLAAGATSPDDANLTIPATTTDGIYYILFVADYSNTVEEEDETNNVAYQPITVTCTSGPDLIVAPQTPVTNATCGSTSLTVALVTNNGDQTAEASTLHYYFSDDTMLDANDIYLAEDPVESLVSGAKSGEYDYLNIPNGLASGTYYILLLADADDAVDEINENNNIAYRQVNVTCNNKEHIENDGITTRNYPNPFSTQTTIEFDLLQDTPVTLFIANVTGKRVATLLESEQKTSGTHQVIFDTRNYPAGMYYYTIQAGEYTGTRKMTLIR